MVVCDGRMLEHCSYRLTLSNLEVNSWKSECRVQSRPHLVVQADRKPGSEHEEGVVVLGLQYPDR